MAVSLESVGSSNLPSRTDFASMKEDLAFKEGEIAKSKQTLEGLAAEHTQLKVKSSPKILLLDSVSAKCDQNNRISAPLGFECKC